MKHKVLQKLRQTARRISAYQVPVYAANASFFILLSIFPGMMLLIGLLQYTPVTPSQLSELLSDVAPTALMPLLDYMTQELFAVNSVALLSASAVTALWSASRGVYSLFKGLNNVYHVQETRNYFLLRLRCTLYTVLLLVALLLTLVLQLLGKQLLPFLEQIHFPGVWLLISVLHVKHLVVVLGLTVLFCLIFLFFPNRRSRLREVFPGAFAAAVAWVAFSALFSFYATRFGNYSVYYGSLSVIALTMLWLYCCISILFYCGILNRWIEQQGTGGEKR